MTAMLYGGHPTRPARHLSVTLWSENGKRAEGCNSWGQPQGLGSNLSATNTARISVLETDQYAGHLIALVLSFDAKGCAVPLKLR